MEQLSPTEMEILKDLDAYASGVYLKWRLLNLKTSEMGIGYVTGVKYKKILYKLFGINIHKRRIEKQEVA